MSGSFTVKVEGLNGRIHDLATLKQLCEQTLQQLGWTTHQVTHDKQLYTAFGKKDKRCDLTIYGPGPKDNAPEEKKFAIGFNLQKDGGIEVYGISQSAPMSSNRFKPAIDQFQKTLILNANILQMLNAMGAKQSSIQRSKEKTLVRVQLP